MTEKLAKMSKRGKRAARLNKGDRKADKRFHRRDLRILIDDDEVAYWQEVLRRHGLRLGRGLANGKRVILGWNH